MQWHTCIAYVGVENETRRSERSSGTQAGEDPISLGIERQVTESQYLGVSEKKHVFICIKTLMPDVNDDLKAMREFSRGDQKIFEKVWKMPGFKEALLKKGVLNGEEVREVIREFAFPDDVIGSKGGGSDGGGNIGSDGDSGSSKDGSSTGACVSAFVISMFCTLAVIALFAGIIKVMKVHRRREERDKKRWWARNKLGG